MKEYGILELIDQPSDLKNLTDDQLQELCQCLRQFLLDHVSKTGGHLASNLGMVEVSVALERVFDSTKDRIVFDVGHQSYVHKILTGRKERFGTLRTLGGISGFPYPPESPADASVSGHASVSVSVALGMARARTLSRQHYQVVAVIGDGALTGGMAYEAMNNAGASREPLIVILNDNNMSIAKNVGAVSKHLSKLRIRPEYLQAKTRIHRVLDRSSVGKWVASCLSKIKNLCKMAWLPTTVSMFEQMGFTYLGPADGHDVPTICELLKVAKSMQRPVLIHVMTQKGKGYSFSEESPDQYHGVSQFDVETGRFLKPSAPDFSKAFGEELCQLALKDKRICAITAAMQSGTGLSKFASFFPERFFDVGIAEEHAVAMAAGMAKQGSKPVCAIYSTFLQRGYDQLIHDIAIDGIGVVLAVDRAGIVGADGATHNGVFDVGYLRQIPGLTFLAPSNFAELRTMMTQAIYKTKGPAAIRFPRGGEGEFQENTAGQRSVVLQEGTDLTLVSYGILINEALQAAKQLAQSGRSVCVIKLNQLDDFMTRETQQALQKTKRLLVVEDVIHEGCMGQKIAEEACEQNIHFDVFRLLNTGDRFMPPGKVSEIWHLCGIDAAGIVKASQEAMQIE
jgi:1-deoxy-D-xylulose-5-phosphate synthase